MRAVLQRVDSAPFRIPIHSGTSQRGHAMQAACQQQGQTLDAMLYDSTPWGCMK